MSHPTEIPALVARALRKSLELGYVETTRTETGRLLAALAATRTGTIAECGTGTGVGAAWLRTGAPKGVQVITAESDPALAASAADALAGEGIEVVSAEFATLAHHGPFALIVSDRSTAMGARDRDIAAAMLCPGGTIVIDDLPPSPDWPPAVGSPEERAARMGWHDDDRFVTCEVMVAPDTAVLLCTRRG